MQNFSKKIGSDKNEKKKKNICAEGNFFFFLSKIYFWVLMYLLNMKKERC